MTTMLPQNLQSTFLAAESLQKERPRAHADIDKKSDEMYIPLM